MKTAIYIGNEITQLVLTPESTWEQNILKGITDGDKECKITTGNFYETRGDYMRQGLGETSVMIVVRPSQPQAVQLTPIQKAND